MKETLVLIIASLVRRLVGDGLWALVSKAVQELDSDFSKTGTEKREEVMTAAKAAFSEAAKWAISLAIETAVARLRA